MRVAVLGDIHANAVALEAVLADVKTQMPELIISLGDQVNLGPSPRETMDMLHRVNAVCLHGNHERYVLAAMQDDPTYAGANYESLRFTAKKVTAEEITLPKDYKVNNIDNVTFTHAMLADDYFPLHKFPQSFMLLAALNELMDKPLHLICGHSHNPLHFHYSWLTVDCVGSIGCMDRGIPGVALYHIATLTPDGVHLVPRYVPYRTDALKSQFIKSGMAEYCPIMAHVICLQMEQNRDYLVPFVRHAFDLLHERHGGDIMPLETWQLADRTFNWPDGMMSEEFWKKK